MRNFHSLAMVVVGFVFAACGHSGTVVISPRATTSYVRTMSLPENGESVVSFDTGVMRGTITIAVGIPVGYRNTTVTGGTEVTPPKTTLTVKDHEMVIEESRVRIGERTIDALNGDVAIDVRADGVFVNGTKAFDL